ncbi:hypothetical protein GGU11DRAFT_741363 [Lentinula aff. detonsa]|uniref:Uncharacterized protein n=1 Tax=Lentinula detonsa TaxID=2804962 RepID=A0AA38Q2U7_9AGAR|nr:hypothetical protein GGU11DRAFT_741363 [Lentinula aff. detonsa]KAJ3985861.1 hypothetical protein F5890DRAFT_1552809 [Lentinula detonsa]
MASSPTRLDTPARRRRNELIRLAMMSETDCEETDLPNNSTQPDRQALFEQVLKRGEALAQTQRNLLQNEVQRRMAEELLLDLESQVKDNVDELTQQVNEVNIQAAELKRAIAMPTPQSTPTRNRILTSSAPSMPDPAKTRPITPLSTPIRTQAGSTITPSRPPPGITLREEDEDEASKGDPIYPGSKSPAYVVYIGKEGKHGVFYAWSTYNDVIGAFSIYQPTCHTHVIRSFSTRQLAHQFYDEFLESGIADLLAEQNPTKDERFIVVEGVAPAAYKNRKSLIMDGLQFRGGVVYRYIGTLEGARSQFNKWKAQGLTQKTYDHRTTF